MQARANDLASENESSFMIDEDSDWSYFENKNIWIFDIY